MLCRDTWTCMVLRSKDTIDTRCTKCTISSVGQLEPSQPPPSCWTALHYCTTAQHTADMYYLYCAQMYATWMGTWSWSHLVSKYLIYLHFYTIYTLQHKKSVNVKYKTCHPKNKIWNIKVTFSKIILHNLHVCTTTYWLSKVKEIACSR